MFAETPATETTSTSADWYGCSAHPLRLDPSKTQVMWFGTSQQLAKITVSDVPLLSAVVTVVDSAPNLGVIIDSQLCLDAEVAAVCRCGYYQLRQLRPVIRSLSAKATETLVQAFVSSRLDYCNSLLYGVADGLYRRLQSVQNAVARLVSVVDAAITSRRPYDVFIGYPCDSEYGSKSLSLFTNV